MTATQSHQSLLEPCIEACFDCLRDCETCANACLDSDMVQMMAQCIQLCRDCADTCAIGARFMSRNSDLHAQLCSVCVEACDRSTIDFCVETINSYFHANKQDLRLKKQP